MKTLLIFVLFGSLFSYWYWASIKEEKNRVSQELDRINTIEFSLKEARKKTIPCPIKNLKNPRDCFEKSRHKCSWDESAWRCNLIRHDYDELL